MATKNLLKETKEAHVFNIFKLQNDKITVKVWFKTSMLIWSEMHRKHLY